MKKNSYLFGLLLIFGIAIGNASPNDKRDLALTQVQTAQIVIENLQAGKLQVAIEAQGLDPLEVVDLKISGKINGTDLRLLRAMAGADELGNEIFSGKLEILDLALADIVEGGVYYIKDNKGVEYPTQNNELGIYAFFHCHNLKKFTFPNSITELGPAAFSFCQSLETVIFSSQTLFTNIPQSAFYGNVNLGYDQITKTIIPVLLPDNITSISNSAFYMCRSLFEIKLPAKLEAIEDMAFMSNDTLQNINFPQSLKTIGDVAFGYCDDIVSLTLPQSIEMIGDGAFQYCRAVNTPINIPASLTSIGSGAFFNMLNVPSFDVATDNPSYSSMSGILYNKDQTTLINYPCNGNLVNEFSVPSSVKTIDVGAFYGVKKVKKLFIPASVTVIEENWCSFNLDIEEIEFAADNTIDYIDDMSFCFNLKKVTLPASLKIIGTSAFEMCVNLKECPIPSTLEKIGDMAFTWAQIEKINIPKSLTEIGLRAFFNCGKLYEITVEQGNPEFIAENNILFSLDKSELLLYSPGIAATSFTVPESVTNVADGAFASNRYLKQISFPDNVSRLGMATLYGCSNLTKVTLPDNLTRIPSLMCIGNISMESVNIPKSVKIIEEGAFSLNTFPGANALTDLALKSLVSPIEKDNKEIVTSMFNDLLSDSKTQGAPTIGSHIIFPKSLTSVGVMAFVGCKIETLETLNPTPIVLDSDKEKTAIDPHGLENSTLLVPKGSVSKYEEASQWEWFSIIKETDPSSIREIESSPSAIIATEGGFRIVSLAAETAELKIVSLSGIVEQVIQVTTNQFIPAQKGLYIVTLEGKSSKKIVF